MAKQIYFDDSALAVVNDWMDGNKRKVVPSSSSSSSSSLSPFSGASSGNGKGGLGFKIAQSKSTAADKLQQRMKDSKASKQKKKDGQGNKAANNNKSDDDDDDDDDDDGPRHGSVDKLSGSKASSVKKAHTNPNRSLQANAAPPSAPSKKSNSDSQDKEAAKKRAFGASNNNASSQPTQQSQTQTSSLQQQQQPGEGGREGGNGGAAKKRPFKHLVGLPQGDNADPSQPRKRPKTRSKQKNIRKDNRPDDEKPSYLHKNSSDFAGRPLTQQTKAILGLPTEPGRQKKKPRRNKNGHVASDAAASVSFES